MYERNKTTHIKSRRDETIIEKTLKINANPEGMK